MNKRLAIAGQDNGVSLQSGRGSPRWNAQVGADGINVAFNSKFMGNDTAFYFSWDGLGTVYRVVLNSRSCHKSAEYLERRNRRAGQLQLRRL